MKYSIFVLLFLQFMVLTKSVTVNLVVQAFFYYAGYYQSIIDDFNNKYTKENNLDIELNLILYDETNSTYGEQFYSSTVHSLLSKQIGRYDVYIYDPLFTRRYAPYFLDLQEYLPKEHMDMYTSTDEAKKSCYFDGKWLGLPLYVKYKVLYSNKHYLDKYKKQIPKTWDELIETTKDILEGERKEGNTNIMGYNGLMPDNDITTCSIYEYLYSFRKTKDSPMPEFNSQRAVEAFEKFNKIKEATSSNDILKTNDVTVLDIINNGTILFTSSFDNYGEGNKGTYYISEMPGEIDGINGSCLTGLNVGIANYLSDRKIKASVEVVKYLTSIDIQKRFFVNLFRCFTAIKSLYDDAEVCKALDCRLAKNIQSIPRPGALIDDYDTYSENLRKLFYQYLNNERPIKNILIDMDNLMRIHWFNKENSPDIIFFVTLLVLFYVVLVSPLMLFIHKVKKNFLFLTKDGWILYTIGFLLMITNEVLNFGELTRFKCDINPILFSLSFAFIYTPIIQRLICNIPILNRFSSWVASHRILFNGSIILLEILYNLLYLIQPYRLKAKISNDNNNHYSCVLKDTLSITINSVQLIMNACFYLIIVVLIFLEWNIANTRGNIKNLTFTIATSGPCLILLIILKFVDIQNFRAVYRIRMWIIIIFVLTNHVYVFYFRLFLQKLLGKGKQERIAFAQYNHPKPNGYGYGYGKGYGNGYGSGSGYGNGYGSGSGHGNGYGSGSGHGNGYGSGSGHGNGYGSGSGHGNGYGSGSGHGNGYGSGSGHGNGYGSGNGYINGYGIGYNNGYGNINGNSNHYSNSNNGNGAYAMRNSRYSAYSGVSSATSAMKNTPKIAQSKNNKLLMCHYATEQILV